MGEGLFQPMHLLIIFVIALLVFGPKRLPEMGKGLGEAIRGFKDAFKSSDATPPTKPPDSKPLSEAKGSTGEPPKNP
jgi:sec-independent protein translocase protein TatA